MRLPQTTSALLWTAATLLLLLPGTCQTDPPRPADKSERRVIRLRVEVTDNDTQKPVKGAKVIVEWVDADDERVLATNESGIALWSEAPHGKVSIRVVADDYAVGKDTRTLTPPEEIVKIKLKPRPEPVDKNKKD